MSRRLDRPLGVAAIAALAVALGAVAVVQWLGSRTLPEAFQYVVPNANGYLVTGPLRDLRRLGPKHGARVFSQAASSEGKRLTEQVNEELNNRCLTWDDLSEPAKLGLDDTRGASFSIVDNQAVAALPVADSQRFAMFVDRFNASRNLSLSADVPANKVLRAIRIDFNQSKGVRICGSSGGTLLDLPDGTSVELSPWEAQDVPTVQALKVTVSRIGGGTAEVRLRCTGLFTDGTSSNCTCQFGKQPEKNCTTQAVALEPMQAEATASGRLKLIRGGVSDLRFHLLDDRMALLGGGDDAAVQAVANAGENFRFFRGDDTLLATIRHLKKVAGADDGHRLRRGSVSDSADHRASTFRGQFRSAAANRESAAPLADPAVHLSRTDDCPRAGGQVRRIAVSRRGVADQRSSARLLPEIHRGLQRGSQAATPAARKLRGVRARDQDHVSGRGIALRRARCSRGRSRSRHVVGNRTHGRRRPAAQAAHPDAACARSRHSRRRRPRRSSPSGRKSNCPTLCNCRPMAT